MLSRRDLEREMGPGHRITAICDVLTEDGPFGRALSSSTSSSSSSSGSDICSKVKNKKKKEKKNANSKLHFEIEGFKM